MWIHLNTLDTIKNVLSFISKRLIQRKNAQFFFEIDTRVFSKF